MTESKDISHWGWKLALASAAAIWGGSFVVIKDVLDAMPAAWLMALRFSLAAVILAIVFRRRLAENFDWSHLAAGVLLGVIEGTAFVVQNIGLETTTPGRNAFLTAVYCVLVPFVNWIAVGRRPGANNVVAAALCLAGVGLLSLGDDLSLTLGVGDGLTLLSAVLYAVHIVLVSKLASAHDVMTLTIVQIATSALVALGFALALEPMPGAGVFTPGFLAALAYLVILASCVAMVVQNFGQSKVPPAQAALLLSMESLFAVLASVVFYHEQVTTNMLAGFGLIFLAVLASEVGGMVIGRIRGGGEVASRPKGES